MNTLQDLFVDQLRDIYSAEEQIIAALPKMERAASNEQLKSAFRMHLEQTQMHKRRLERIFADLSMTPSGKHCKGMEGLIQEGEEVIQEMADPQVKDAALITAAQRVEHYEMAAYGTVRTFANELGFSNIKSALQETLDEEGATDKKLTALAEGGMFKSGINTQARQ
jgi:ferritin-like metal-binding protein YciE